MARNPIAKSAKFGENPFGTRHFISEQSHYLMSCDALINNV